MNLDVNVQGIRWAARWRRWLRTSYGRRLGATASTASWHATHSERPASATMPLRANSTRWVYTPLSHLIHKCSEHTCWAAVAALAGCAFGYFYCKGWAVLDIRGYEGVLHAASKECRLHFLRHRHPGQLLLIEQQKPDACSANLRGGPALRQPEGPCSACRILIRATGA